MDRAGPNRHFLAQFCALMWKRLDAYQPLFDWPFVTRIGHKACPWCLESHGEIGAGVHPHGLASGPLRFVV